MKKVKEKITREIRVLVQPSLYEKFEEKCENNYKTISDVIRELMLAYVGGK